ncbi:hypothetical protein HaLaN_08708 [Haematococcus lacustris]|uniref:Uncharacterized protein n=1 Tax=Haematococcus lacustris TaxID=44745 RepID=A0A699Z0X7_HAELA|nr:hypothetical protein HaLaN_08708 [Haematococcus lacustris]
MKLKPCSKRTHNLPAIYNDPSRSPWFSSFISPLYTEHLGGRILLSGLPEGSLAAAQATLHTSWTASAANMTDYM